MSANPGLLNTVHDLTGSRVTVSAPLVHLCPHVPETDVGTVELTWTCHELTVELHSLAAYLASWSDQVVSHEELTLQLRLDLEAIDGIEDVVVTTRWRTAGMVVSVAQP